MNGVAAAENAGAQVTDDSHGFTEFHHHHLLRDSLSVNTRFKMMISTVDSGFDSGSSPELHMSSLEDPPMSRTHQYRKVMKPLLERKRRARINKCLDDLKDLMVTALQSEGESITKLEKADVLELTVKHLQKLKRQNALGLTPQATYAGRFKAGYAHCAQEVSKYMSTQKNVNVEVTTRLFGHLGNCMQALESMPPSVLSMAVPPPPNPPASQMSPVTPVKSYEEQIAPLDLIKNPGKENQAQDLSLKKVRNPLTNVNEKWRPW